MRSRYLGKEAPRTETRAGEHTSGPGWRRLPDPSEAPIRLALPTPPALGVRSLGTFVVWRGKTRLPAAAWKRRRAATLFRALLSAPEYRMHREQAAELLWPDTAPERAHNSLRFTLHQLRALLDLPGTPGSYIQSHQDLLILIAAPGRNGLGTQSEYPPGWHDAGAFAHAAAGALAGTDPAACRAALALYTGPYLPDDRYEDWAVRRREDLAHQRLLLLLHHARLCTRLARSEEALAAWQAVLAVDPCQEEAVYALMRLLARGGRIHEALRVYAALAEALRLELDVTPAGSIEQLRIRLLAQDGTTPGAPDGAGAAMDQTRAAPRRKAQAPTTNLPVAMTSFIGRCQEQDVARNLLTGTRLLTITGMGGCGKTRLALQVAQTLIAEYADGVWLIELAGLVDPALLPQEVSTALGLGELAPGQSLLAALFAHLRTRHLLLVLDNCEHLLDACAEFVGALLAACPEVCLLITSREILGVPAETTFRVSPLSLPNLDHLPTLQRLAEYEAIQLFLERARAQRPDFALSAQNARAISEICARLDGFPLAIELAAVRVSSIAVEDIAARLDDRFLLLTGGPRTTPPRHRSLEAALDWSHDLLSEPERLLLRRLAVFAGGATLEAAEAVCAGGEMARRKVLDILTSLVHKSMVVMDDRDGMTRYWLQETMRQYADEKLSAGGEAIGVYERHLHWCLTLARASDPALLGSAQPAWLDRLAAEHENLRVALTWSMGVEMLREAGPAAGLLLAGLLWPFWWIRGHLREGRHWLEQGLATGATAPPRHRARALDGAGVLAADQGDYAAARARHEESLLLWRSLGDTRGIAGALNNLGLVAQHQGDHAEAQALHEESLALWRDAGDAWGIAGALNQLGCIARDHQGALARATALLDESLTLRRRLGDTRGIAISLNNLGLVDCYQGAYERARVLLAESLALRRTLGDTRGMAISLGNLALVATRQGQCDDGAVLYAQSLAIQRDLGDKRGVSVTLVGLATIAAACRQPDRAALLLGAAAGVGEAIGLPRQPSARAALDEHMAAVCRALGEDAFAATWSRGWALSYDEVIAYAAQHDGAAAHTAMPV